MKQKQKIDFFGDGMGTNFTIKDAEREKKRFLIAMNILPEMARQCYEEGQTMHTAVADAVEYADKLLKELEK